MLAALLFPALLAAAPQTAYPQTPQQVEGRQSSFIEGTLNVPVGERATLRANADGTYDLIAVDRIDMADVPPGSSPSANPLNGAAPGTLRFGLQAQQGIGTVLKIENSQEHGLKYAGFIVRFVGGQPHGPDATSVCTVPAGLVSYEHWPEPVVQVVIGGIEPSHDTVPTCPPQIEEEGAATGANGRTR